MKIRYRDAKGHFISAKSAAKRKQVTSELIGDKKKTVGKPKKGYYSSAKKLARAVMPKLKKTKVPLRAKTIKIEFEEIDDTELEKEWEELAEQFPEIDMYMDELDEVDEEGTYEKL